MFKRYKINKGAVITLVNISRILKNANELGRFLNFIRWFFQTLLFTTPVAKGCERGKISFMDFKKSYVKTT
jgi:hypothetical protein